MKKGFYSIGGIIILLIAAFIFVLVPALSGQAEVSRLPEYGKYNGVSIKFEEGSEFYQIANEVVQQMQRQYDLNNPQIANIYYSMAFKQAFNRVVGPMALRDLTNSSGYLATESWVDRALIARYYNEAGEFSQAIYNATPDEQKRKYQAQMVQELETQRSYEDIFGSFATIGKTKLYGLKIPSSEIEFIRKMGSELHGFEYVAFDMRSYPNEKTLEYANSNKDKFAKYDFTIITVEDEAKVKDVLKRLNNSEITFDDAVTAYSTKIIGNDETGKIMANRRYQITEQIKDEEKANSVFALGNGAISEPVEINNGWAIFRCDGDKIPCDLDDDLELNTIKNYIFSHEKGLIEDYYTAVANDFIAAAATTNFDEAARKFEKNRGTIEPFALNHNNTTLIGHSSINDLPELNGATSNENFLKTAFSLKSGEISKPIVISSSDNIVVLRCTGIEQGGTDPEDAPRLIGEEINSADVMVVNSSIEASPKIQSNEGRFMAVFTGMTED